MGPTTDRHEEPAPADERRRGRLVRVGALVLVALLAATLASAALAWGAAQDRARRQADEGLQRVASDLRGRASRALTAMAAARIALSSDPVVDEALFRRVAWLAVQEGFASTLAWAPFVQAPERARFERALGRPIVGAAPGGGVQTRPESPAYVPFAIVVPAARSAALGFDGVSFPPTAAEIARSLASGRPRASGPLPGSFDGVGRQVVIYEPVRRPGPTSTDRREGLLGFVVASVDLRQLDATLVPFGMRLLDGDALLAGPAEPSERTTSAHVDLAGRRWTLQAPVASASLAVPGIALGSGLLLCLALGVVLATAVRRERYAVVQVRRALARRRGVEVELAALASTDHLTGLANTRTFQERLAAEYERARRHGRPLSLIAIDLDHFKQINDAHGHQVGDEVLREAARRLGAQARAGELMARVGGEEFAWLLPETDAVQAFAAAERARRAVASRPFGEVGRLTISAGVSDADEAPTAGELVRLSDAALYWAKAHGRNQSFRYSPELADLSPVEQTARLERARSTATIRALARAVDAKDPVTHRHSERVADLAVRLASQLGWPAARRELIREAGLAHDVGKIGVPDALLFAARRLDAEEERQVRAHAGIGGEIVTGVLGDEQAGWIRHHHERWDGSGYPDGLRGERVPDGARILALAEAWDAMTVARSQPAPLTAADALEECRAQRGRQFGPSEVGALEGALSQTEARLPPRPS